MELYSLFFLSEFTRLKRRVDEHATKKQKKSPEYALLNKIHIKYRVVFAFRVFCLIMIYISLIAAVTSSVPLIGALAEATAYIVGVFGIPVFTVLWLFLGKIKAILLVDAQFMASKIISKRKLI